MDIVIFTKNKNNKNTKEHFPLNHKSIINLIFLLGEVNTEYNRKYNFWIKFNLEKNLRVIFTQLISSINNSKCYEGRFNASIFIMLFYSHISFVALSPMIESDTYNFILTLLVVQWEMYYCFLIAVKQNKIYYLSVLLR